MLCPKCEYEMETVEFASIEVDRCRGCQGVWFDALELETLVDLPGSEILDTGDPGVGLSFDSATPVLCPRCSVVMEKDYDPQQPSIQFECCTQCLGVYFDAGEFTGLREGIVAESARRVTARRREADEV